MAQGARIFRVALVFGVTTAITATVAGVWLNTQAEAATSTYVTTAKLNVRSGPSTSSTILTTLKKGAKVQATAAASNHWVPITYAGKKAYVSADYLKATAEALVSKTTTKTTTVNVNLRGEPSLTADIVTVLKKGTPVTVTSNTSGDFTAVTIGDVDGWVATRYLTADAPDPTPAPDPKTTTLYINANGVNVRALPDTASTKVATLALGTPLQATGAKQNSFTAVLYDGETRWVYSIYLSDTKPKITDLGSTSLNKLQPYGKAAVLAIRAEFPQIVSIGGWRSYSAYSSDHPSGRAIDIMIPNYKSNKALGDSVAAFMIANAKTLHVKYIIWRQRYYPISRGTWSKMANRGSDTQNHMNHVHVSFYAS